MRGGARGVMWAIPLPRCPMTNRRSFLGLLSAPLAASLALPRFGGLPIGAGPDARRPRSQRRRGVLARSSANSSPSRRTRPSSTPPPSAPARRRCSRRSSRASSTSTATSPTWDYKPDHENFFTGYYPELPRRDQLATVLNCTGRDIALTQNATFGMNFVANGLDLKPGDEVVVTDQAHPGGRKGYDLRAKRDGIVVRRSHRAQPPQSPDQLIQMYLDATTPRTRVWAIPHISSSRAIRYPVKQLCALARERSIWSVVDGAQSLGHVTVDVQDMGCDAFFASPHKWMLAPKGTGLLYVRPERQKELWATLASSAWDDQTDPMYRLMQYGTGNLSLLIGLGVAVEFHNQIGSARIQQRDFALADRLRTGLKSMPGATIVSPTHPDLTCGTTVYGLSGKTGAEIQDYLWNQGRVRVRSMGDHRRPARLPHLQFAGGGGRGAGAAQADDGE